jgi:hypothetical protein
MARAMRQKEIRAFVERHLLLTGGRVEAANGDLLEVTLPGSGDGKPPAQRLLAFGARAHRGAPEAELVAVGSAFLDRLIQEATATGRYTVVHEPPPRRVRQPKPNPPLPAVDGWRWGSARRGSRPRFLFVYISEYHTIDVPDDLVLVSLDPATGECRSSADGFLELLAQASRTPIDGWPPLPALPTAADVIRSLDALDRRLQRRARRVKEASALEIARETANIEAYYRQLIAEARAPVGRAQVSPEEEAERVRSLQLDWKRRVQEVSRFWEARGDVRLSALGVAMQPCWVFPLLRQGAKRATQRKSTPYAVAALRNGALAELRCGICGARLEKSADIWERMLICVGHSDPARRGRGPEDSE